MKRLLPLFILIVSICGASKVWMDHRQDRRRSQPDIRYLPSPQFIETISSGYKPVIADLYWIDGLNYFGGQLLGKDRTYTYLDEYLRIILTLDPAWEVFYEWAATSFIYNGLPISRSSIVASTRYVNLGIQNLHGYGRMNAQLMSKGAFNFALEAQDYKNSLPYFASAARLDPTLRDLFVVGSAYAQMSNNEELSNELKLEYLAHVAFEVSSRSDLLYALQLLTSPRLNKEAGNVIRAIRLDLEKDSELKKIVAQRLRTSEISTEVSEPKTGIEVNPQLSRILNIDFERNWLHPNFHLLLSL